MATDIPGLGGAQYGIDKKPLERMREALQVLIGTRGDPLDAALTLRAAIERGLIDRIGNAMTGGVTYVNTFPGYTFSGAAPYSPDLTPPPTVTGLSVVAGFTQVIIQVDAPTYTVGHGNKQTNIYAVKKAVGDAAMPTFVAGTTPRVFSMPGPLTICSLPSELNTRWHVWAKYESVDGVESTAAAGGANGFNVAGVYPTTGMDITQLLNVLTGSITESQLYAALGARINLIDAADTVAGSVAKRVKDETDARITALTLEAGYRVTGDSTTLASAATAATTYTQTWAYQKSATDSAIAASGSSLTAAYQTADNAVYANAQTYVGSYAYAKSTVDSALSTLDSSVRAAFATADANTLASANSFTYARSAIDSAIASSASTLTANYGSAISSAVATEATARTSGDSATTALVTTLRSDFNSNGSAANRLKNASFAGLTAGQPNDWAAYTVGGGSEPTSLSMVSGPDGYPAIRVSWTGPNTTTKGVYQSPIKAGMKNNVWYIVAFKVRANVQTFGLTVSATPSNAPIWADYTVLLSPALSTDWQWYVAKGRRTGGDYGELYISISGGGSNSGASSYDISQPVIHEGEVFRGFNEGPVVADVYSFIQTNYSTTSDMNSAITSSSTVLVAGYSTAISSAISTESSARASGDSANASSITTLSATVGANTSAISAESSARTSLDGSVAALYTVRVEASSGGRTIVGGYGLSATSTAAAGPRIDFGIRADQFYIAAPAGAGVADVVPFVVRTTSTVENGVAIPAGVYMNAAYIVNLSAMYARFGTLIADSIAAGSINAAKLTLGDGTVGGDLKSTSFSAGSGGTPGTGWKLTPGGVLYASNVVVYGTIYAQAADIQGFVTADQIDARGLSIKNAAGTVILAAGSGLSFNSRFGGDTTGMPANGATVGATWGAPGSGGNVANQPSNTALYNNYIEGGVLHIARPVGAAFSQVGDAITGAIKITLPQSWTDTMLRFFVEIYEYTGSGSATYEVGGYNYGGIPQWVNCFARYTGPNSKRRVVTFGHDGTSCCIWIGTYAVSAIGPAWSYPQVRVSSFVAGYSNAVETMWATGWSITMATGGTNGASPIIITAPTNGDVLAGNNLFDSAGLLLTDSAIKNSAQQWAEVSGVGRPDNGATANQSDATTNGAIANAGTIANWSGVANNDGNRPANGATVNQSDATTNGAISGAITTASTDATNKANAAQAAAIASANAGLANKLSSSANSVLNATVSMNATAGAGFVAGNLTWSSTGAWVSGSGVALTPGGLVGYNASGVAKFAVDTAGNATFAGALSAATGTFGTLTVATGGSISSGQSAYNTGTGFWLGLVAGTPKFSVGNPSGASMRWDGTDLFINAPNFDAITVSISGAWPNYSSSVSGGRSGYQYAWILQVTAGPQTATPYISSGINASSCSLSLVAGATPGSGTANLTLIVKDANGRTTFAAHSLTFTNDGFIVGGGD